MEVEVHPEGHASAHLREHDRVRHAEAYRGEREPDDRRARGEHQRLAGELRDDAAPARA